MQSVIVIAAKDLLRSFRDRSALVIAVLAPLGLAFILSTVLGGAGGEAFTARYAVVNEDRGRLGNAFVGGVLRELERAGVAEITSVSSAGKARELAEDGEVAAAFVIPAGFSRMVEAGEPGELAVVTNPESEVGAQIARSVARQFAAEANAIQLAVATVASARGRTADRTEIAALAARARALPMPVGLEEEGAGSREFTGETFFAAGMAVFFLFFTTQFGAVSLLRERREGTLARLLAAPISRRAIVGAKALFTFTLGVTSMTVLVLASTFLLGAEWGNPAGVAALVVAGVFAAMGIQSLVTTLAKTDEQAAGYGSIVAVTLGLLGGTFFPLSEAPGLVADLSLITPHAWLMRGLGALSGGSGGVSELAPAIAALVAFGAFTGGIALLRARTLVVAR